MYILDKFLTENNCTINYLTDNESNKIKITFFLSRYCFLISKKMNFTKN